MYLLKNTKILRLGDEILIDKKIKSKVTHVFSEVLIVINNDTAIDLREHKITLCRLP